MVPNIIYLVKNYAPNALKDFIRSTVRDFPAMCV